MTYKQFRTWAEGKGYEVFENEERITAAKESRALCTVRKDGVFEIDDNHREFRRLPREDKKNLFEKIMELAATPLDERVEDKRYKLRHRWMISYDSFNYLNKTRYGYSLASGDNSDDYQTMFTEDDIEEIKEKFKTDLSDFEIFEVE